MTIKTIRLASPGCRINWITPVDPKYWRRKYGIKQLPKYLVLVHIESKVVAIYESRRKKHIGDKLWPKEVT